MPNLWILLKIMLTIPITVAAGKRRFSTLKFVKTFLRLSMCENRSNSLGIFYIKNKITKEINIQ